jgi:hypothetical protein
MNFPSKLTLAVATAAVLCPIAAYAGPTTGSTAAAVSIKFDGTAASGYSTIAPGGTTSTGGSNGIKELSAAVATGESSAIATSSSYVGGTNSSANGWSAPVTFNYTTSSDVSNKADTLENYSKYQTQNNSNYQSAYVDKNTGYNTSNEANATNAGATNGTKGKAATDNRSSNNAGGTGSSGSDSSQTSSSDKDSSSYSTANNNSSGNKNGTFGSSSDKNGGQSGSAQNSTSGNTDIKTSNILNTTNTRTNYNYTGSSAGLSYIPIIK